MREFGGEEINEDYLDDLVDCWHDNPQDDGISLEEFVMANTGWFMSEYAEWAVTGKIPD